MNDIRGRVYLHRRTTHSTQDAKNAPAATRTPTAVAQIPVTPRAPLLPLLPLPLKEPDGTVVEEVEEDVPVNGVREEPGLVERPETEGGLPVPEEGGLPVPEEVEEKEEVVERGWAMSNIPVWESTELMFAIFEAWKVYPEPIGTEGRVKVMFWSDDLTELLNAKSLRKMLLVR